MAADGRSACRIGLIADTHGLLRPSALAALAGSDCILHAGDIGSAEILEQLAKIAPVIAVRGNNDTDRWALSVPEVQTVEYGGRRLHLLHDLKLLALTPAEHGIAAVISGHSHRPLIETRDGVLYVNPGSAGPRRFQLPISVAQLSIDGERFYGELITLT